MLTKFYFHLYNLLHSEEGQDLAEYAILLGIIAVLVIAVILGLSGQITRIFQIVTDRLAGIGS